MHCNAQIGVAFRFEPFTTYATIRDPAVQEKVKNECREEIAKKFNGIKNTVAGPMPRSTLEVDKNGATQSAIEGALEQSLLKSTRLDKLWFRKANPQETIYEVIDGETYCKHPLAATITESPPVDWELDLKDASGGKKLKAYFFFLVSWGTPLDRDEH